MTNFNIKERLPLRWLPRRFEGNILSIFTFHITAATSRSRRLLNSFDDLKREVRASKPRFEYFTSLWKAGLFAPYQMWKGDPERSRKRAQLVQIHDLDLTRAFMYAREDPWAWITYKEDCHQKRSWGEHLRSNMDWEWDTGGCLKRLFEVDTRTGAPSPRRKSSLDFLIESERIEREISVRGVVKSGGTQEKVMRVSIEEIHTRPPKTIQVSYVDTAGMVQLETYHSGRSAKDGAAEPDVDLDVKRSWPNHGLNESSHEKGLKDSALYVILDDNSAHSPSFIY